MGYKSDLIDVSVVLVHETEKAYLVSDGGKNSQKVWVPKSQCEYDEATQTLTLPERIAHEKGLI